MCFPEESKTAGPQAIREQVPTSFLTYLLCQSQLPTLYFLHYSNKAAMKIGVKYKSPSIVSLKCDDSEVANLFTSMIAHLLGFRDFNQQHRAYIGGHNAKTP